MLKQRLKQCAETVVPLPAHFQLAVEEYFEGDHGEGEAMYAWVDEQREEEISLTLDLAGNLTSLTVGLNKMDPNQAALEESQLKEQADQFLSRHYPHALEALTCGQAEKLAGAHRFHYEQLVRALPLAHAGCYIDVAPNGEVVNFKYHGLRPEPAAPKRLIGKEKLIADIGTRLDFQLIIADLDPAIYEAEKDGLRLVYEIEPFFMTYKAAVSAPTLTAVPEEEGDQETYAPLPSAHTEIRKDLSNEEIIGITQEMEIIRKADWGKETGIVWRERNWDGAQADLSINRFFQNHNEDTVKALISKKTGRVKGFMWFKKRHGDLNLNREDCYRKAIDFLQLAMPNSGQFLQLVVQPDDDVPDDARPQEPFSFRVHNGCGIPVYLETVRIAVNRQTGRIDHYSGLSFELEELQQLQSEPAISKKEAHDIFLQHLDFELAWHENYEEQAKGEMLVYRACDRVTRKSIRYIDAVTGQVITGKE